MVGKCANPECSVRFKYLRDGKLFHIDMREYGGPDGTCEVCGCPLHVRHFWLCNTCSQRMTIAVTKAGLVQVIDRPSHGKPAISLPCASSENAPLGRAMLARL